MVQNMLEIGTKGFLVAIDGPNGAGKSTLIETIKNRLEFKGHLIYTTREPTNTECGSFVRKFAESHSGMGLACLVAADRYEHIENEILPELKKGKVVITDRYILSSLILQQMDGVSDTFLWNLNSKIIKPDLQVAVFADEAVLQKRLSERDLLTRFEKGNQSYNELFYMNKGIVELEKRNVDVLCVYNNSNLENNVEEIVSCIIKKWRAK